MRSAHDGRRGDRWLWCWLERDLAWTARPGDVRLRLLHTAQRAAVELSPRVADVHPAGLRTLVDHVPDVHEGSRADLGLTRSDRDQRILRGRPDHAGSRRYAGRRGGQQRIQHKSSREHGAHIHEDDRATQASRPCGLALAGSSPLQGAAAPPEPPPALVFSRPPVDPPSPSSRPYQGVFPLGSPPPRARRRPRRRHRALVPPARHRPPTLARRPARILCPATVSLSASSAGTRPGSLPPDKTLRVTILPGNRRGVDPSA